jgi:hypothetical protein
MYTACIYPAIAEKAHTAGHSGDWIRKSPSNKCCTFAALKKKVAAATIQGNMVHVHVHWFLPCVVLLA